MDYRSSASLFGLPLVHVAMGQVVDGQYRRGTAKGWVAVGDVAYGALLAGWHLGARRSGGLAPLGGWRLRAISPRAVSR